MNIQNHNQSLGHRLCFLVVQIIPIMIDYIKDPHNSADDTGNKTYIDDGDDDSGSDDRGGGDIDHNLNDDTGDNDTDNINTKITTIKNDQWPWW